MGSDGNKPYTLAQLIAVLNKDEKIWGNNGYPRSDRGSKGSPYVLTIDKAGLLDSFLKLRSFVLSGTEAEKLVNTGYGLEAATRRQRKALDAWSDIAAQIKQALSNGKIDLSEALSALMAAADALNIAPNRSSVGFSELFGQHVVKFLEIKNINSETLGQSIKSEESLKKFLDDINLSPNNRDHLTAFLKEKYKNLNGREMPKTDKEAVAVSSSQFVKDWGGWIFAAIVSLGAGASGILNIATSGTTNKTSQNLGDAQDIIDAPWYREAADAFVRGSYATNQWEPYLRSGTFSTFFEFFPETLASLQELIFEHRFELTRYEALTEDEKRAYIKDKANLERHAKLLVPIAEYFTNITTEQYTLDLNKLTAEERKRLIDNLLEPDKYFYDQNKGTLMLTGKQWLELLHRSQPNLADAFLSSTEFKELKQTWADKGWIKLSPTNDLVLADPANVHVRNKMKQEFKEKLESYVEYKVRPGEIAFTGVGESIGMLANLNETGLRTLLENTDWSNTSGTRNNIFALLLALQDTKQKQISATVNNFNSQIDNMAGTASTTLTTVEQSYVEGANQAYNLALATQQKITSSMRDLNAGSPRFNTDIAKIEAEISSLSRFSTTIRSYRTSLLESRELGGTTNKNIPQVVSDALSEMNRLETQIRAMQTQLTTELNRKKDIATTQQQTVETQQQTVETQRIAQQNLDQSKFANEQREIERITRDYKDRRVDWNDRVAKLEDRERNNPSMVTQGGSWVITPQYINGFRLPPPDAGTLDEQVEDVVKRLVKVGAFDPNAINIPGIDIDVKDSTDAREIIRQYYLKFKKYDTGEPPKLPPDHGYQVPGQ